MAGRCARLRAPARQEQGPAREQRVSRRLVYMDYAATTPLGPGVLEAMLPYLGPEFGNPQSVYDLGQRARQALEGARQVVADVLGARTSEIIFTGSGTEAANLAVRGVALALKETGNHIITSAIEHAAVLRTCEALEKDGFAVTYLPVDETGLVDPDAVGRAITPQTILVSVIYASNEVGTVQPVADIGRICRQRGVRFHTDAAQAPGRLPLAVGELDVDLLSLSGHKFGGPKGSGVLFVRRGTPLQAQIVGGPHERSRRAGTEAVHQAVGLAVALKAAESRRTSECARLIPLRDRLIQGITAIPGARLTGQRTQRLPNLASFVFEHVDGEALLLHLDRLDVAASSASSCTSGTLDPSHVLAALGIPRQQSRGSLRLSLGAATTRDDVEFVISVLPDIVAGLQGVTRRQQDEGTR